MIENISYNNVRVFSINGNDNNNNDNNNNNSTTTSNGCYCDVTDYIHSIWRAAIRLETPFCTDLTLTVRHRRGRGNP